MERRNSSSPATGFIITNDGQYDRKNKRLCNFAAPTNSTDAVNLITLQLMIKEEVEKDMDSLRNDGLKNLDELIEAHRDGLDRKIDEKIEDLKTGA